MKWTPADEEGIIKFLVADRNFNEARVRQVVKKINADRGKSNQGTVPISSFTVQASVEIQIKEGNVPNAMMLTLQEAPKQYSRRTALVTQFSCFEHIRLQILHLCSQIASSQLS